MDATLWIVLLWLVFAGTHMGLSSVRLRPGLVKRLGAQGFLGMYSAVALASFVPLCWVYFANRHEGPLLWLVSLGPGLLWTIYVLNGIALVLVTAALVQPSPVSLGAPGDGPVRGVQRLTRHGLFMGIGLVGLTHLVPNGFASDVAFFGGLPLFALVGGWHQDRRKLATDGERFRAFHASTPFLPFTGRETLRGLREVPWFVYAVGILLAIGIRWLHR